MPARQTRCAPSPACGGGLGRGWHARVLLHTPSLSLPRLRGRERTECAARTSINTIMLAQQARSSPPRPDAARYLFERFRIRRGRRRAGGKLAHNALGAGEPRIERAHAVVAAHHKAHDAERSEHEAERGGRETEPRDTGRQPAAPRCIRCSRRLGRSRRRGRIRCSVRCGRTGRIGHFGRWLGRLFAGRPIGGSVHADLSVRAWGGGLIRRRDAQSRADARRCRSRFRPANLCAVWPMPLRLLRR